MVWLTLAMLIGFVGAVAPTLLYGYAITRRASTLITAEALEVTGGLEPGTFEAAYWIATALNGACVLWSLWRLVRRRRAPWLPLVLLSLTYALLFAVVVGPDAFGDADLPDGLVATVQLGIAGLWTFVLPVAALVLVGWALVAAWRAGLRNRRVADRIAGAFVVFGAAGVYVHAGVLSIDHEPERRHTIPLGDRAAYETVAQSTFSKRRKSTHVTAAQREEAQRNECFETLATHEFNGRPLPVAAKDSLTRKQLSSADAEDLVMTTILKVCQRHGLEATKWLVPYFWGALKNGAFNHCKLAQRRVDLGPSWVDHLAACPTTSDPALRRALNRCLALLTPAQREAVVRYVVEGYEDIEIAALQGKSAAAVRKARSRALTQLSKACQL